jgi:hypothetical protein
LIEGRMTAFFSILLVAGLVFYFLRRIKSKSDYPLRKIAALEAIDEVVGRATELGRPVFFSGGQGDVVGNEGTQVLAGLDVLGYVAKKSAEYNTQLVAAVCKENVHAITEGTVKAAYTEAGHPEMYQPEMVRFLSPTQMAYTAASISIIQREKVAASILIGPFAGEALIIAEAAAHVGAIGIAGTARLSQLPLFVAASDYVLIGEEMFAGSAYLSGDPSAVSAIATQDVMKIVVISLILIGSFFATASSDWLPALLRR